MNILHGGRRVRLKWHMLRRRGDDPPFHAPNIKRGLAQRAALEVDLVINADGDAVCLHDLTLDRETTGAGPVRACSSDKLREFRMRSGAALLTLVELVAQVRAAGAVAPGAVQLDVQAPLEHLDAGAVERFAGALDGCGAAFAIGGRDWRAVRRLGAAVPQARLGFDPIDLWRGAAPARACDFEDMAHQALDHAPEAAMFYFYEPAVRAGLDAGANMLASLKAARKQVDCWRVEPDQPDALGAVRRLAEAGADQITTDSPVALANLWNAQ